MTRMRIRSLKTHQEFRQCEEIQDEVWGESLCSSQVLIVTQKYGGVVLGAVTRGRVAGFLYAFLARRRGRLIHWSHIMAVRPEFRNQGLGFRMKLLHRRLALKQGVRLICWTFDPLQSRNAMLNIHRLGAQADEYVTNCYGKFPSRIEQGLPSDRFVAAWEIASLAVERRLRRKADAVLNASWSCVNETCLVSGFFLKNCSLAWNLTDPRLLVEIPSNTDAMRAEALSLARRWRDETRRIFRRYFARGYRVTDFIRSVQAEGLRCFYVLTRRGSPDSRELRE